MLQATRRCQFCSETGSDLQCNECGKRFHRHCVRYPKSKPADEYLCEDCDAEEDYEDEPKTKTMWRRQPAAPRQSRRLTQPKNGIEEVLDAGTSFPSSSSSRSAPAAVEEQKMEVSQTAGTCENGHGAAAMSNDFCEVCQLGGKLLLCEQCPRAFHVPCVERLLDEVSLGGLDKKWACPVCQHGVDILRGRKSSCFSQAEMEAKMKTALSMNRRQRNMSLKRRDALLSLHQEQIVAFASRPAWTRIKKAAEQAKCIPLEIGASVQVLDRSGTCYQAIVLAQSGQTRYIVSSAKTNVEDEVERSNIHPLEEDLETGAPGQKGSPPDFLGYARKKILDENVKLKDYQKVGVNWLIEGFHNRGGGILADDMGLGKTLQTLAYLSYLHASGTATGPFLVVVPLSCAGNWIREAKRFVPHLSVGKVCGAMKERQFCLDDDEIWYAMKDIIITTYETMTSTEEYFQRHCWSVLVLDEAHRIKNQSSRIREALDTLECTSRLLLTGTPLQNNLGELFALLKFLWPDVLAKESSEVFNNAIQLPELFQPQRAKIKTEQESGSDVKEEAVVETKIDRLLLEKIRGILGILMLRRRKEDVISLPPKVFHEIWLPLTGLQASWYRTILSLRHVEVGKGLRALLKLVVRLRQISSHPRCMTMKKDDIQNLLDYQPLVKKEELEKLQAGPQMSEEVIAGSGKLAFLDKLLQQLHAQNMGLCDAWRKAYEDRKAKASESETYKRKGAAAWLKCTDGLLFLDDMRPHKQVPGTMEAGTAFDAEDEDATPRPHKVLIFTQYHNTMDLLEAYCTFRKWRCLRLDGATNRVLRELDMRDFNSHEEDHFIYLIGTRAGGLGINLATANHVVIFEQDWNPHVDHQAIDRAHRIGQSRKVNIYRLVQEWGIEERLLHRGKSKLRMENCVINKDTADDGAAADGEADLEKSETLSAEEVLMLLQHGEGAMKDFPGESIASLSLQAVLDRPHRALPTHVKDEPSSPMTGWAAGLKESSIQDEGEGSSHKAETKDDEAPSLATPPPPPQPIAMRRFGPKEPEDDAPVRRTASGRVVKAPTPQYVPVIPVKVSKPKEVIKHYKQCFVCGDGQSKKDCAHMPLDVFCSTCPQAYHKGCIPANARQLATRWACTWHQCGQCGRSQSDAGMLIHCLQCPSALCHDCFPPSFRRVYPPDKFWADIKSRGWNTSPQKMVFFKCNSCRTLEEQQRRHQMRAEDLEAQQDEKKAAALEEKRNLAATKKRQEEEEARHRMKMHLLEHERQQLQNDQQRMRERVTRAGVNLWPPTFWNKWLLRCNHSKGIEDLATEMKLTKAGMAHFDRFKQALELCSNCSFPGHKVKQCPVPAEKVAVAAASETKEEVETGKSVQKRKYVCPTCETSGHSRISCPKLSDEQRAEYESRCGNLRLLSETLEKVEPGREVLRGKQASDKALAAGYKEAEAEVRSRLHGILKELGLEAFIVAPPAAAAAEAKESAKARAKEEAAAKAAEKLAAKAAARAAAKAAAQAEAKAKPKAKAKAKAQVKSQASATMRKLFASRTAEKRRSSLETRAEERNIAEGPAKGWSISMSSTGAESYSFQYREPESVEWMGEEEASKAASAEVWARLQVTCEEMIARLKTSDIQPAASVPTKKRKAPSGGKPKAPVYPQEVREIVHGPAQGWMVRGKAFKEQSQYFVKKPGGVIWESRSQALKELAEDDPIREEVEKERLIVLELLQKRMLAAGGQDPIDVAGSQSDPEQEPAPTNEVPTQPAPKRSGIKRLRIWTPPPAVVEETIEIGNSQDDPEPTTSAPTNSTSSTDDAKAELSQITHGAAVGWTVKVNLPSNGPSRWLFRNPKGTKYERLSVITQQGLDVAVLAALQAEQASMASRIGSAAGAEPAAAASPQSKALQRGSGSPKDATKYMEQTVVIESVSSRGRKRFIRADSLANKRKAPARQANGSAQAPQVAEGVNSTIEPQDVS